MIHLKTRNDIIEFVEYSHDWGSIRIAIQDSRNVEFLGFFSCLPFFSAPGWILRVKSGACMHQIAVYYRGRELRTRLMNMEHGTPWMYWQGDRSDRLTGDNPERYKELRNEAQ